MVLGRSGHTRVSGCRGLSPAALAGVEHGVVYGHVQGRGLSCRAQRTGSRAGEADQALKPGTFPRGTALMLHAQERGQTQHSGSKQGRGGIVWGSGSAVGPEVPSPLTLINEGRNGGTKSPCRGKTAALENAGERDGEA